jgi:hypothetical protein
MAMTLERFGSSVKLIRDPSLPAHHALNDFIRAVDQVNLPAVRFVSNNSKEAIAVKEAWSALNHSSPEALGQIDHFLGPALRDGDPHATAVIGILARNDVALSNILRKAQRADKQTGW